MDAPGKHGPAVAAQDRTLSFEFFEIPAYGHLTDAKPAGQRCGVNHASGLEHPEDLGMAKDGQHPGSMWQWASVQALASLPEATALAFSQCQWPGSPSSKPTRTTGGQPVRPTNRESC